jgi:hypothetical protein
MTGRGEMRSSDERRFTGFVRELPSRMSRSDLAILATQYGQLQIFSDVLYAPGLPSLEAIREVCISVSKPVTVVKGLKGATLGGTRQPEGVPSPPMVNNSSTARRRSFRDCASGPLRSRGEASGAVVAEIDIGE